MDTKKTEISKLHTGELYLPGDAEVLREQTSAWTGFMTLIKRVPQNGTKDAP